MLLLVEDLSSPLHSCFSLHEWFLVFSVFTIDFPSQPCLAQVPTKQFSPSGQLVQQKVVSCDSHNDRNYSGLTLEPGGELDLPRKSYLFHDRRGTKKAAFGLTSTKPKTHLQRHTEEGHMG